MIQEAHEGDQRGRSMVEGFQVTTLESRPIISTLEVTVRGDLLPVSTYTSAALGRRDVVILRSPNLVRWFA